MSAADPTSLGRSFPPRARGWTVDDVAQAQAATRLSDDTVGATAGNAVQTPLSGRYRGTTGDVELELRVDIDGVRPTTRVSGDFFRRHGGTWTYDGSFIVHAPAITTGPEKVEIEGGAIFTFQSAAPTVRVSFQRVAEGMGHSDANVQFVTTTGEPGESFTCRFESEYFRQIEFEQDCVEGVTPFDELPAGAINSGNPNRSLTVRIAFAESGIDAIDTGATNGVPISLAGSDRIWSNRELHDAMETQFSRWTADPAWRVWLLAATIHEKGQTLRGIMFDSKKRQGCAVFHDVIGGSAPTVKRAMLRTYVHELGHCFNLFHSHHKEFMSPPRPNRLDALSWMHYPGMYRSSTGTGEAAYWAAFPFQFDDDELVHLRHGFRDAVVPGGNRFGVGAADVDPDAFRLPMRDESGLRLELRGEPSVLLGTPVLLEIKLSLTDLRGRTVNSALHPNYEYVHLAISKNGTHPVRYRPFLTHCVEPRLVRLDESNPAVYDSAYIGYGKDGFYFDSPATYTIIANYTAPDGSLVVSNAFKLRVQPPATPMDVVAGEALLGDEQGKLLYLLGSDSEHLAKGRDAMRQMIDAHPNHALSNYARLVEGMNCAKPFKKIVDRAVVSRAPQVEEGRRLLQSVVDATTNDASDYYASENAAPAVPKLDNISLNMAMDTLLDLHTQADDQQAVRHTAEQCYDHFVGRQHVPSHVEREITNQMMKRIEEPEVQALRARYGTGKQ